MTFTEYKGAGPFAVYVTVYEYEFRTLSKDGPRARYKQTFYAGSHADMDAAFTTGVTFQNRLTDELCIITFVVIDVRGDRVAR